jgi:trehalose 6-phosphate synthase
VPAQRPLIIVSNRGPVTYDRDEHGARIERRGGGGLVTALRGLRERHDVTWIASATTEEDRVVAAERSGEAVFVAHDPRAYDLYYNVVANPMLWFIQHSLWGPAFSPVVGRELHEAWHAGYETVNRAFADEVVAQLDNRPVDWTTLPRELRLALHEGLLANDVLAFHTERWARNFERSCADLGCGQRKTLVTHHPISIDTAEFDTLRENDAVLAAEASLERPEKLIVRVDRTDPSKNIARGFRAFGIFLDEHPEWRGRVKLLARLDPSRESIPEYVEYRAAIDVEAAAVTARYPGALEVQVADDFPQSVAAYKQYDVLLVNAVYDGMNLVAKEGPLVNARDGVLVLSENAGAHEELAEWALTVNLFDVWGQAEALHEALTMEPQERRRRAQAIQAQVREHDVTRWVEGLLADLDGVSA